MGLSDLLNDIIDYSNVEAGRLELFPEPLDPAGPAGVPPGEYVGRMSRTTLYGEAASSRSRVPGPITSYGGDVTFASPPTRDRS